MRIALTVDEFADVGALGLRRLASALEKKRQGAHGWKANPQERYRIDVEGMHAEYAASRALGLEFDPAVDRLDALEGDLPGGIQVRSTRYPTGSLLIHDRDPDTQPFILVTGEYGVYDIRGWIYAENGKHPSLWKMYKGRGAYWVPQHMLHDIKTLPPKYRPGGA